MTMNGAIRAIFPEATDEQVGQLSEKFEEKFQKVQNERDTQIDELTKQIKAANEQIESFESMDIAAIKESAEKWRSKYEQVEKEAQEKLHALRYETVLKELSSDLKFSSNAAKKAFISEVTAKKLPLDGDKITGFKDFLEEYRAEDPGAFAVDEKPSDKANSPAVTQLPGGARSATANVMEEQDEAQRLFAQKGVNFASTRNFHAAVSRSN
ncbi:MAG: phage scaffolding protein [Holosporales bacterium]|jgi:TolA-binding protein|nr:phage scaffolding protein [Holosporales bacterium]